MLTAAAAKYVLKGLLGAGALPLCAPAADGDAGLWCQLSPDCQQISHKGAPLAGKAEECV